MSHAIVKELRSKNEAAWERLGRPYDAALARLGAPDETVLRQALATFDGLGAKAVASAARRRMKALGIKTIAEYVEDIETLEALRQLGVDYGQGFGIARPMPLEKFQIRPLNAGVGPDEPAIETDEKGNVKPQLNSADLQESSSDQYDPQQDQYRDAAPVRHAGHARRRGRRAAA